MRKIITKLVLLFAFSFSILSSCNKTDVQNQLLADDSDETSMEASKGGHHGPHNGPHHGPHHGPGHHNNHCDCDCHCPDTVATATRILYEQDFATYPDQVGILVNVYYTNPGDPGTFRVVLRTSTGAIDSISIVTANHTDPGVEDSFQLQYWIPVGEFPSTLYVTGRPADLECDIRSRRQFTITDIN